MKIRERQIAVLPKNGRYSLKQWAAFSLRYSTAWANWKVAYGSWRLQMPELLMPTAYVCAWGGGVGLAEVTLAKFFGCRALLIASSDERLRLIEEAGVEAIDRRRFPRLDFDAEKYETDRRYRADYLSNESAFLEILRSKTDGFGVSIFIDNIGRPVFRATVKALGRQGVVASVGWKRGMHLNVNRAPECINRHIHVFTHGASYAEGIASLRFAEETGWLPPVSDEIYAWGDIDRLAQDFADARVKSYFPLFEVNPC